MFKKKNKQIKTTPNKSNLEQVLWFIENYLPQKKDRGVQKKLYMNNLEAESANIGKCKIPHEFFNQMKKSLLNQQLQPFH